MPLVQEITDTKIHATVRNGHFEPDEPLDLPEGARVSILVTVDKPSEANGEAKGRPLTAEELDRLNEQFDKLQPLQMSESEIAAWEADRLERKEIEKANFFERADKLARLWT